MKKWNFQNEVKKMHRKQINSLHTELSEKEEAYLAEVKKAGFDNLHDYEMAVSGRFMKRVIIFALFILLCLFATTAKAQFYLGVGTGFSVTKQRPIGELQIGYSLNEWIVQTGYQAHIDNRNPAMLQVQAGRRFHFYPNTGLQVSGGYCYHSLSSDNPELNKSTYIISAAMFRPVGGVGEWWLSGSFTPGFFTIGIGMRGFIMADR